MLYVGLALLLDPRREFGTGLLPGVTLDSRLDKMRLFKEYNRQGAVEGIVLGSSRAMKLSCDELEKVLGLRWFNFSVDSARAEDYLAIYRWVRSSGARPKVLVIALDVEALHDSEPLDGRLRANPGLMVALDDSRSSAQQRVMVLLRLLKGVFSTHYVRDMLLSLRVAVVRPPAWVTFDTDGFLHYVQWEKDRAAGKLDFQTNLERSYEEYRRRFADMQGLSTVRKDQVATLIREAQQDGVRIVLWITPVHPKLAAFLDRETPYNKRLDETRVFVEGLRRDAQVPVVDFSVPGSFTDTADGWYDGAHMDEKNSNLVTGRLATELRSRGF